jgi:hypothetical protein
MLAHLKKECKACCIFTLYLFICLFIKNEWSIVYCTISAALLPQAKRWKQYQLVEFGTQMSI